MSNHHIVHFKYLTILFLSYTTIKLKQNKIKNEKNILRHSDLGGCILIAATIDYHEE